MRTNRVALVGLAAAALAAVPACTAEPEPAMRSFDTPQALAEATRVAAEAKRSVVVDLDLSAAGRGTCELRTTDFAASCRLAPGDAEEVAYVMVPDALFVRIPQGQAPQPDKPWLRLDPNDANDPLGQAMAEVAVRLRDTADLRKALPEGARITGRAEEELSGRRTVRYTAEVSADGQPSVLRLWVDEQDLPVRSEVRTPAEGGDVVRVADYRDWGAPVEITPPAPEQVGELPGLPG
ncbi:hypothetical protein [Saccharothrix syringae]|uniref:Lipoprotein n=1 Tax=Saccharothrix syringae TaxID=103733 RepID=A0A5Q0H6H2_SACSY|nr:hypothetical protein [Saccharothrix syringae]QFZ21848.1 hypothetical protein EKG83_34550 [Saccharothrix syringae]